MNRNDEDRTDSMTETNDTTETLPGCTRCGAPLTDAHVRALEDGSEPACPSCGLLLPPPPVAWLMSNGYNLLGDLD